MLMGSVGEGGGGRLVCDDAFLDPVLYILSAWERRCTIRLLQAANGPMATADLARKLLNQSRRPSSEEDSFDGAEDIEIALHHVHLPKLQSETVVDLDVDRKLVSPGERFETFASLLESVDEASASY